MKRLILITLLFGCLTAFGQNAEQGTIYVPYGADTTAQRSLSWGGHVSIELDWSELDGVDTLCIYGTNHPDSSYLSPLWVDNNLDGANDNPWALEDSASIPPLWSDGWPWDYLLFNLKKGTSTSGLPLKYTVRQLRSR